MILNFTQHKATTDQIAAGVFDAPEEFQVAIAKVLTFDELPTTEEINQHAHDAVEIAYAIHDVVIFDTVIIGGAPFFIPALADRLDRAGFAVCFAFSKRESVDVQQPDGSVRKTAVFKHDGFVPFCS